MSTPIKTQNAAFLLRKNGFDENLVNITGNIYDITLLYDVLKLLVKSDEFDYLIIEPIKELQDTF